MAQSNTTIQNIKGFKFEFQITVEKIKLAIAFQCKLQVILKRGTTKVQSNNLAFLEKGNSEAVFNENLNVTSSVYFDEKQNNFLDKKASFTVLLITEKGSRVAGTSNLNLCEILNDKVGEKRYEQPLLKCPDKHAKIFFVVQAKMIQELSNVEMMSGSSNTIGSQQEIQAMTNSMVGGNSHVSENPGLHKKTTSENLNVTSPQKNKQLLENYQNEDKTQIILQLNEYKQKLSFAENKTKSLETQLSKTRQENDQLTKQLQQQQNQDSQANIKKMKKDYENLYIENTNLKKKLATVDELTSEVNQSKELIHLYEQEEQGRKQQEQQFVKQINSLQTALNSTQSGTNPKSEKELKQLKKENQKLQSSIQDGSQTIEYLSQQLVKSKEQIGNMMNAAQNYGGHELQNKLLGSR